MTDVVWYLEDNELAHDDLATAMNYEFINPLPSIWWSVEDNTLTTAILSASIAHDYIIYPYPFDTWYVDENDILTHTGLPYLVGGQYYTDDDFLEKDEPDICKEYPNCKPYRDPDAPSTVNRGIYGSPSNWIPYVNSDFPDSLSPENDYYVCNFDDEISVAHEWERGLLEYAVGWGKEESTPPKITWGKDIDNTITWSALGDYHPLATQYIKRCKYDSSDGKLIDKLDTNSGTPLLVEKFDKVDYVLDKCSATEGFGNTYANVVLLNREHGYNIDGLDYYLWGFTGLWTANVEYHLPLRMNPFVQMPLHNMLFQIRVIAIDRIEVSDSSKPYLPSANMIDVALEEYLGSGNKSHNNYPYIVRVYMKHYCCNNEADLVNKAWSTSHYILNHVAILSKSHFWDGTTPIDDTKEYESFPSGRPCHNISQVMFRSGVLLMGLMSGAHDEYMVFPRKTVYKDNPYSEHDPVEQPDVDTSENGYFVTKHPRHTDNGEPVPWATHEVFTALEPQGTDDSTADYYYHSELVVGEPYWEGFEEDCIRAAAGFGVFFTPNDIVSGLALDDDDVFLGILDDDWIGHGDFSRGIMNRIQKQWDMKTTRDSWYAGDKKGAFYGASNLKEIEIPKSVKFLGAYSFNGTDLSEVTIASDCEFYPVTFPESCEIKIYEED